MEIYKEENPMKRALKRAREELKWNHKKVNKELDRALKKQNAD